MLETTLTRLYGEVLTHLARAVKMFQESPKSQYISPFGCFPLWCPDVKLLYHNEVGVLELTLNSPAHQGSLSCGKS